MSAERKQSADEKSILFRTGDPDFMTSLARGIEVIRSFADTATGIRASDISKRTGLSRAVVRRCLYTLSEMGYVSHEDDGYYLKPKILSLSQTYFGSNSLPSIAQDFLERVKESTGESCSLSVLEGQDVIYVARSSARRIMAVSLGVGSRLPAYCTSLGRVLIAALPEANWDDHLDPQSIKAHTRHTQTSSDALKRILKETRQQGYALVDQELEIGLRSLAVPVRNHRNQVVASMNIGVQAGRVSKKQLLENILPTLQSAASELKTQLIS